MAPVWLKVPLLGRDTIELEVIWSVAILRSRVVHALPPVDTPVVETESLCGGKNLNPMIRQSAIAVDAVAAIAISARSPALSIMSRPPTFEMHSTENEVVFLSYTTCRRAAIALTGR